MNAIRDLSPFAKLEPEEEMLFDDLVVHWHAEAILTVSDVINDTRYPSPTTAYRRVMALKNKGIVALEVDAHDKRVKHVRPTKMALLYIQQLENGVAKLISDAQSA